MKYTASKPPKLSLQGSTLPNEISQAICFVFNVIKKGGVFYPSPIFNSVSN